jgi:hypothetical protein
MSSWRFLSSAALSAADYTSKMVDELTKDEDSPNANDNVRNIVPPSSAEGEITSKPMTL